MPENKAAPRLALVVENFLVGSLERLVRQSTALMSEDFFFTQPSQSLSLESDSRYHSSFGLSLYGLSFNSFSTNALGQKPPLYARCVATVGNFTYFFGPSAPDTVSTKQKRVFAASEESTVRGTVLYSRQNLHNLFEDKSLQVAMFYCFLRHIRLDKTSIINFSCRQVTFS